jgi:hypothetical protein
MINWGECEKNYSWYNIKYYPSIPLDSEKPHSGNHSSS